VVEKYKKAGIKQVH